MKSIYNGEEIPQFEKTERSVDILYDLMIQNKDANKDADILVRDYQTKSEEYDGGCKWRNHIKWSQFT